MSRPLACGEGGTLCVLLLLLLLLLLRPLLRLRPRLRLLKLRLLLRLLLLLRQTLPAELWPVAEAAGVVGPELLLLPELLLGHLVLHHLLVHHLVLHHLVVLPLLLLLRVLRELEALVWVVLRGTEGVPPRVLLAPMLPLWLWLWLHCTAWRVVPADPAVVVWALALLRKVARQPQLAGGVRLRLVRVRRSHRVRLKNAGKLS